MNLNRWSGVASILVLAAVGRSLYATSQHANDGSKRKATDVLVCGQLEHPRGQWAEMAKSDAAGREDCWIRPCRRRNNRRHMGTT